MNRRRHPLPITLKVSIAKHVDRPEFGSQVSTCEITLELDTTTLHRDPDHFLARVREIFVACQRAVDDDLARHPQTLHVPDAVGNPGQAHHDHREPNGDRRHEVRPRTHRPATPSQRRALHAIAGRRGIDLAEFLRARSHDGGVEALSILDASRMIDALRVGDPGTDL